MIRICLIMLVALLLCGPTAEAQKNKNSFQARNGIGLIPSNASKINGWAIGWMMLGSGETDYPQVVNGMYTNISPIALGIGMIYFTFALVDVFNINQYEKEGIGVPNGPENKINGLSISLFDFSKRYSINGLQVSIYDDLYRFKGLSVGVAFTGYSDFRGVMISGLHNKSYTGKGLQIALVNRVHDMKGVQIGLINKIGKRTLPFINMKFH